MGGYHSNAMLSVRSGSNNLGRTPLTLHATRRMDHDALRAVGDGERSLAKNRRAPPCLVGMRGERSYTTIRRECPISSRPPLPYPWNSSCIAGGGYYRSDRLLVGPAESLWPLLRSRHPCGAARVWQPSPSRTSTPSVSERGTMKPSTPTMRNCARTRRKKLVAHPVASGTHRRCPFRFELVLHSG